MQRFTQLYLELDQTTRTSAKVAAMRAYFEQAPPEDAAWALHALAGNRIIRSVSTRRLRSWVSDATGYPMWLIDESYNAVGDLAETLALLLPATQQSNCSPRLSKLIEMHVLPLPALDEAEQQRLINEAWQQLDRMEIFLFHKLITGALRVGVSRKLVVRALAEVAETEPAVMDHRLLGKWHPSAQAFEALLSGEGEADEPGKPYPFYLASPLESDASLEQLGDTLGDVADWQIEWKWDGIRAQLIRRQGQTVLWSRGEERVNGAFPEVVHAAAAFADGTVVDGELLAWEDTQPLGFQMLQRRIGRKRVEPMLFPEVPVTFMAYDLLEQHGEDLRDATLLDRRTRLEALLANHVEDDALYLSPLVRADTWQELESRLAEARERGVEGLMLKKHDSPYGVGRRRGAWWKLKVDPFTIDAVLVNAQHGHGRRAGLFTDYTFAVWHDEELVPVAKAYSGLTNEEIRKVDSFIRRNTMQRFGPVHAVKPELVFELAFEGIGPSDRHKSGIALRFPRMARWRHDKKPTEADTLENLRTLMKEQTPSSPSKPAR